MCWRSSPLSPRGVCDLAIVVRRINGSGALKHAPADARPMLVTARPGRQAGIASSQRRPERHLAMLTS